jgi:hypothetical protein
MSKLIDKFRKSAQSSVPPMGFRTAPAAARAPGLLLIASAGPDFKNIADFSSASAFLIRPDGAAPEAKDLHKIAKQMPDVPIGLYLEDIPESEALEEAGLDFMVFPVSSRVAPAGEKMGRILEVESSLDDNLIKAINSLPVDAVLAEVTFEGGSMIWHELLIFQHLANTIGRPLIVGIPANIAETELKALWAAGADAVMVDVTAMKAADFINLEEAIGKLPPRPARKHGRMGVLLPRAATESPAPPPDEEEEDE